VPSVFAASSWRVKLRRPLTALHVALVGCLVVAPAFAQYAPASTGGFVELDAVLQRLGETRRVLMIGAHPDDEDTRLLALLARGYGVRAAYLSLSRGDGGQNLIGQQLGEGLGLLRTRELEEARRIDGAEQFFTRAYDFGYSRSYDETATKWLPDSVLKDVVRIVRRFQPHVIIAVWSGTERDGHGQHTMAGVMAQQVFEAAGDVSMFSELSLDEGLQLWEPGKLFLSRRFGTVTDALEMEAGALDPRTGRSFHQIAMESRSQHRSQDMGVLEDIGPVAARMILTGDHTGAGGGDIFAGVPADTSWIARLADSLRTSLNPSRMPEAVGPLTAAVDRAARQHVPLERQQLLQQALAIAGGLVVDAFVDVETVVPGDTVDVVVRVYNAGQERVSVSGLTVHAWDWQRVLPSEVLAPGADAEIHVPVVVPDTTPPTQPYFLIRPRTGDLYDWTGVPSRLLGLPDDGPAVRVVLTVNIAGQTMTVERGVAYRFRNQAIGEIRRPLRVVPAVEVALDPPTIIWRTNGPRSVPFTVTVSSNLDAPVSGTVALTGAPWALPDAQPFTLSEHGESQQFVFTVERPARDTAGHFGLRAVAEIGERHYTESVDVIDYDHINAITAVRQALADVRVTNIALPTLAKMGYVRGASDRIPETVASIGLDLELLDAEAIGSGDLSAYDVIVIGPRAYETSEALRQNNRRLLEYVAAGGTLLVQYQQYQFVNGGFAPFPLTINRPHDRITDETAPVTMLEPAHPALNVPNVIGEADWLGWVQERGLYFAGAWDEQYLPLLEMQDPGMAPIRGGLLVADYGEGTYIYSGISFFRTLPGGSIGAYKLFMNLLALADAR
jgi:LmbE family N-acetylglucosaminyl deacetylase